MNQSESVHEWLVNAHDPAVITFGDGSKILYYSDGSQVIWGQRYGADGAPDGQAVQINSGAGGSNTEAVLLADGSMVVIWGTGATYYGQRVDADGIPVGDPIAWTRPTGTNGTYEPELSALTGGDFLITWYASGTNASTPRGIYVQSFSGTDSIPGPQTYLQLDVSPATVHQPDVQVLADGSYVVTWAAVGEIHGQRFNNDGTVQGGQLHINTETAGSQTQPHVIALEGGGFTVFWRHDDGVDQQIRFQSFTTNGATLGGEEILLSGSSLLHAGNINEDWQVIALEGGGFAVLWRNIEDDTLRVQSFDDTGQAVTAEVSIISAPDGSDAPDHFTADLDQQSDGSLIVTWEYNGQIFTQSVDAPPCTSTLLSEYEDNFAGNEILVRGDGGDVFIFEPLPEKEVPTDFDPLIDVAEITGVYGENVTYPSIFADTSVDWNSSHTLLEITEFERALENLL